ncbi:hypothetical protein D1007_33718 [Hordeum vulgare]|nr:hypothetical protein D1007_33718 [Hordeum vulgare]
MSSICKVEHESPFIPQDASYAKFSSELVKDLEGAAKKVDDILEECCDLFSMAATRVFSHLLLRDPRFEFKEVMGPVPEESCYDLATTMEGHVNMLPGNFFSGDGKEPGEEPPVLVVKWITLASRRCQTIV